MLKIIEGMRCAFTPVREGGLSGHKVEVFSDRGKVIRWGWAAGRIANAVSEARQLIRSLEDQTARLPDAPTPLESLADRAARDPAFVAYWLECVGLPEHRLVEVLDVSDYRMLTQIRLCGRPQTIQEVATIARRFGCDQDALAEICGVTEGTRS